MALPPRVQSRIIFGVVGEQALASLRADAHLRVLRKQGTRKPGQRDAGVTPSRPYNPVTHDDHNMEVFTLGGMIFLSPPLTASTHTRPLMRLHGGRIGLQCGITVAVVQGFALGPSLQGTTLTGRGDSSIYRRCDGTVWFFIPPCTSNKRHMFYTQHAHTFQCCSAQLLAIQQLCVRKQRGNH